MMIQFDNKINTGHIIQIGAIIVSMMVMYNSIREELVRHEMRLDSGEDKISSLRTDVGKIVEKIEQINTVVTRLDYKLGAMLDEPKNFNRASAVQHQQREAFDYESDRRHQPDMWNVPGQQSR